MLCQHATVGCPVFPHFPHFNVDQQLSVLCVPPQVEHFGVKLEVEVDFVRLALSLLELLLLLFLLLVLEVDLV